MIGDASEIALMKFFQPIEDIAKVRESLSIAKQFDDSDAIVGFNSSYKFALIIFELGEDSDYSHVVWLKGAPERIWEKCGSLLTEGESKPIDGFYQESYDFANRKFALEGERVLGFARILLSKEDYPRGFKFNLKNPMELPFADGSFQFVGLISLIDPPKIDVPDAVKKCQTAGVKVIMVTGDQQLTAASIAKKIGIFTSKTSLEI